MRGGRTTIAGVLVLLALGGVAGLARPETVAPAPSQAPLVATPTELCESCHADVMEWTRSGGVHAALRGVRCLDCHAAHASRHAALLRYKEARLCTGCHRDIGDDDPAGSVHATLRGRACEACHQPHAAETRPLLRGAPAELCLSCHQELKPAAEATHPHAPFAMGSCAACHDPHASGLGPLLVEPTEELCGNCHRGEDHAARHAGIAPRRACATCHDPHGSERAGLLRPFLHDPFAEGGCDTCHAAADDPALLAPAQELCTICHEASPAAAHPGLGEAAGEASCVSCHSPHAGSSAALLQRGPLATCTECHSEIATLFEEQAHGHPLTAGCVACHDPHAGAGPALLKAGGGSATCDACHGGHATFSHPMGPGVDDPSRPGRHVDCMSCHAPHASDWGAVLLADSNRDLCLRCHDTDDPHGNP